MAVTGAPYKVEKRGSKWVVLNNLGEVKGTHDSEGEARAHQAALYANVPGAKKQAEKKSFTGTQKRAVKVKASELPRHPFVESASDSRRCLACGELGIHMLHRPASPDVQVRDEGAGLGSGVTIVNQAASALTEEDKRWFTEQIVPMLSQRSLGAHKPQTALLEINGKTLLLGAAELGQSMESAPNKHFGWMIGNFVGAEKANRNGAYWSTADLEFG